MPRRPFARILLQAALFAVLLALIYARALPGPFVFDDQTAIVANESVKRLWPIGPVLRQAPDLTTSGRPVVALSFAIDHELAGLDPAFFRTTNGAIHLLCALVLAALVRRTLRAPRLAERFGASAEAIAFGSGLLFLVHPLASEVVCYVSARTESLVALFYLATLYCATRAREGGSAWPWVAAAVACSALGMASKEVMVSAPLAVALHDIVYLGRPDGRGRRIRYALWSGLAASWGVLLFLMLTQPRSESAGLGLWASPLVYLANQCRILPEYLRLVFWPDPLRLDYGLPEALAPGDVLGGAALLVGLLLLSLYALRRWPAAGFVGMLCFAVLAPSSSVVPIVSEVGAERRMYLPLAALCVLLACLAWRGLERVRAERLLRYALALALLALGAQSAARAGDYADDVRLWQADVEVAPGNPRARYNLSSALRRAGRELEAREQRHQAVLGEVAFYTRILPLQPDRPRALADLAAIHVVAGEFERAEQLYLELLALQPENEEAQRMLPRLRARRAADEAAPTPP